MLVMFWEEKSAKKRRKNSLHFYVISILHAFIDKSLQQMSMCEIKGFRKKLPPPPKKKKKINKKEMSYPGCQTFFIRGFWFRLSLKKWPARKALPLVSSAFCQKNLWYPGRAVIKLFSSRSKRRFTRNISQKFIVPPLAFRFVTSSEFSRNRCYGLRPLMTALPRVENSGPGDIFAYKKRNCKVKTGHYLSW